MTAQKEFTRLEGLAFCLSAIGVQLSTEYIAQWGPYFYSPTEGGGRTVYVGIALILPMFVMGRLTDAITDPLIGVWSDKTKPRPGWLRLLPIHGRRRPFIFWGSVLMTFTAIGLWFPPLSRPSFINFLFGTLMLSLHLTFLTIALVPLLGLAPEVARSTQARVKLGQWIAVGMIVGLAMAAVLPGVLLTTLDPARRAAEAAGNAPAFSPVGYQRTAILFALLSLAAFQFVVWAVKERFHETPSQETPLSVRTVAHDMRSTLSNSVFVKYVAAFSLFSTGYLATQRVLPNWAETGLGGDESTVTFMMLPFIASALLTAFFVMPVLARFMPTKWQLFISFAIIVAVLPLMYPIARLDAEPTTKFLLGGTLFLICGVAQGMQYVLYTPLLGEIIDLDEQQTGRRREGAYNGMSGVAFKAGQAGSIALSNFCMSTFGNSVTNPAGILLVGPAAGAVAFLGLLVVWRYPVLQQSPPPTGTDVRDPS
ncbi:MAG: MFS transporter [Candidatus Hydrogenedentes bacterium]|nr:MFS transporter [Candidatus Hydrogenedentota bacterium]